MDNKEGGKILSFLILLTIGYFGYVSFFGPDKNLDTFSHTYSAYRNAEFDAGVNEFVPVIDFSKDTCDSPICGKDNYWTYIAGAVEVSSSNSSRYQYVQKALDYYHSYNEPALTTFATSVGTLNTSVSSLIEVANKITNDKYRTQAIKIAELARIVQQDYSDISENESDTFIARNDLLDNIKENLGAFPAMYLLEKDSTKVSTLSSSKDQLDKKLATDSQAVQDAFTSLKGQANLKDYSTKFDIGGTN